MSLPLFHGNDTYDERLRLHALLLRPLKRLGPGIMVSLMSALGWAYPMSTLAEETAQENRPPLVLPSVPAGKLGSTASQQNNVSRVALTPRILYGVLLAEIAARRGNLLLATTLYDELAKATRDPRIAKRATEFGLYTRQTTVALGAARIWVDAAPESVDARLNLANLLLESKHPDDAMKQLVQVLVDRHEKPDTDDADDDKPEAAAKADAPSEAKIQTSPSIAATSLSDRMTQVYLLLSRQNDKLTGARLFEQLTIPFENVGKAQYLRAMFWGLAKDEARALAAVDRARTLKPDWAEPVLLKSRLQQGISSTDAEQTLKDFLTKHPDAGEVRLAYARSLIGGKHYEAARREYDQLLKASPDDGEILYASALLAMQMDDFAAAEQHMKRLLVLGIGNPDLLRFYLGRMAESTKQPDQAIAWYIQVMPGEQYLPALSRAATLLYKGGHLDDGRALLQKAAEAHPQEQIVLLIAESQLLVDAGRVTEAYDLLNQQLVHQPDQPELLYESALLAEKLRRLDVMERNLRKLIRIKPDDAHAYNALGYSLLEHTQRLDEADQYIEKGLALSPEDAFIIDSKGWLLYKRGDRVAALSTLQKAYDLRPDPEIAAHLGEVLWASGKQDEASQIWNAALKATPGNVLLKETIRKLKGAMPVTDKPGAGSVSSTSSIPSIPNALPESSSSGQAVQK